MKIAIPTNDGLTIITQVNPDSSYLVLTLELEEVVNQEMRKMNSRSNSGSENPFEIIEDCNVIIVKAIPEKFVPLLEEQEKTIVRTKETIITRAFMQYLGSVYKMESNLCCCP